MPLSNALLLAALVGVGQAPAPSKLAEAAVSEVTSAHSRAPEPPHVAFEIHDVTAASPDWRGRMIPKLKPIAREESVAVWALDAEGVRELVATCETDPRARVFQAPRMVARLGDPVRMTNEDTTKYVAHLERISDGPPNQGTRIAFQPIIDEVHDGIRVELDRTRLKGDVLFAHMTIRQNKLVNLLTTHYTESVNPQDADPEVVKTSLLSKLRPEGPQKASIKATMQVPEVASRRIEGDWMIPSDGGLLVSMGPLSGGAKAGKNHYEERLIVITARPESVPAAPTNPELPAPASTTPQAAPVSE